jgi:glycosyltransferase involved in cell wall biosynthesis
MKIAVNMRLLLSGKMEGLGLFTCETLKRITRKHPEHQFIFLFDRPFSDEFIFSDNIKPLVLHPQARHPFLWYLFFEWAVPHALKKEKADLFLSCDGWVSLSAPVKTVDVIHDINFEYYPGHIKPLVRQYYHYYFPRFAKKASRIATVSEFSKTTIIEKYHQPADKIDVVYNGVTEGYQPLGEDLKMEIRQQYCEGLPFFIFVGLLHPRKNIANLFRAYDLFRLKGSSRTKLLIAGEKKWWKGEMEQVYQGMQFPEDVVFTGRLPLVELQKVMGAALALTYVSVFEGFGIPIIEAMQSGVPVITGNITSMPEVAGDAALLTDPFSPAAIADAMELLAVNDNLRQRLIGKGLVRCREFTWDRTAEALWDTVGKVLYNKD